MRSAGLRTLVLAPMLLAGLVSAAVAQQAEEFGKPSQYDYQSARQVAILLEKFHLTSHPLDDEISTRAFRLFLKSLDPMKNYFLASDIEEFSRYQTRLDDALKAGDFSPAFAIFTRFLQRVDEGTAMAIRNLGVPHDFTIDEELVNEPDLIEWARDAEELGERWRKRVKYNLLVAKAEDIAFEEARQRKLAGQAAGTDGTAAPPAPPPPPRLAPVERLTRRYQAFARRMHQLDNDDVVELYITAITTGFDPHTTYMSKKTYTNFMIHMSLKLDGIGATLASDDEGFCVVKQIVPGGPAEKQGQLRVEDRIVGVAQGESGEMVDVGGWALDDVVEKIRGQAGSLVRLSVMDALGTDPREIRIVRDRVQLEDQAAQGEVFEQGQRPDGSPRRIGVINLPSFYADMAEPGRPGSRSTTTDVRKILNDFRKQDVDVLVLDLRTNGGGSLREAIDCTGLFIDRGTVVQVKDPYGSIEQHDDMVRGYSWDRPLVVVTNKMSASASEILAGAIKDYRRGLVVGDSTTHGKGTVQTMRDLNEALLRSPNAPARFGVLKITIQQFYRPNGDSTQLRGVLSDIVLPSMTDKMDVAEADLDYPVKFDRIPPASFRQESMVNDQMIQSLATRSQERIAQDERFAREQRRIDLYAQFKQRTALSLNEEKFFEQRREFNAEEEDRNQIEEQLSSGRKTIRRDYYLDEVLRIASDYADALGAG